MRSNKVQGLLFTIHVRKLGSEAMGGSPFFPFGTLTTKHTHRQMELWPSFQSRRAPAAKLRATTGGTGSRKVQQLSSGCWCRVAGFGSFAWGLLP